VLRAIFLRPKAFYLNFDPEGPLQGPVAFVLLVSAVSAIFRLLLLLIVPIGELDEVSLTLLKTLLYVALSPLVVGLFAGAYFLSVRGFVGPEGTFRGVYRILAYAWGAAILFWVPGLSAFAFTYATLVLITVGIYYVYRVSFLTALTAALVAYVPSATLFIFILLTGFVTGSTSG
jgi:hypothetical protein